MKTICFYFQIHQPFRLKRYRFFDIGNDHYYYDDFQNEEIIHRIAEQCYLPANRTILEMIKTSGGKFKVAFSISGVALEQMEIYTPEVIDSLRNWRLRGMWNSCLRLMLILFLPWEIRRSSSIK